MEKGQLWQLKKCLYGLKDASRHWYLKVKAALLEKGFDTSDLEPAIFYFRDRDTKDITGIVGIHVDDFIHAGTHDFNRDVMYPLMKEFKVGKNEQGCFMYTGYRIIQSEDGIMLDQSRYVQNLEVPVIEPDRARQKSEALTESEKTELGQIMYEKPVFGQRECEWSEFK